MAKRELQWSPLLGQYRESKSLLAHSAFRAVDNGLPRLTPLVTLSGAVMVDRKNRKNAVAALEKAGDDMKKKGVSRDGVIGSHLSCCCFAAVRLTRSSSAIPVDLPRRHQVVLARTEAAAIQEGRVPPRGAGAGPHCSCRVRELSPTVRRADSYGARSSEDQR
jgi:hypothetical protein